MINKRKQEGNMKYKLYKFLLNTVIVLIFILFLYLIIVQPFEMNFLLFLVLMLFGFLTVFMIILKLYEKVIHGLEGQRTITIKSELRRVFPNMKYSTDDMIHEDRLRLSILGEFEDYGYTNQLDAKYNGLLFTYRSEMLQSRKNSFYGFSLEYKLDNEIELNLLEKVQLKNNEQITSYNGTLIFFVKDVPMLLGDITNQRQIKRTVDDLCKYLDRFTRIKNELDKHKISPN